MQWNQQVVAGTLRFVSEGKLWLMEKFETYLLTRRNTKSDPRATFESFSSFSKKKKKDEANLIAQCVLWDHEKHLSQPEEKKVR